MVRRKKNVIQGQKTSMLSVEQIRKKYGFHPNTIRAWVNRDGLRAVPHGPGGKLFIREVDVRKFVAKWYDMDNED